MDNICAHCRQPKTKHSSTCPVKYQDPELKGRTGPECKHDYKPAGYWCMEVTMRCIKCGDEYDKNVS